MQPTDIEFEATQWPAGQGGFHTQAIRVRDASGDSPKSFHIIYDCGSRSVRTTIQGSIDAYADKLAAEGVDDVDLLVLSHFDADHVNQLAYLANKNLRIARVLAPRLTPLEKLLLLAVQPDPDDDTYNALVMEPLETLRDLFPEASTELLGPDDIANEEDEDTAGEAPRIGTQPHFPKGHAVYGRSQGKKILWEFAPFLDKGAAADPRVWQRIMSQLPLPNGVLKPEDLSVSCALALIKSHAKDLKDIFNSVFGNNGSNFASLCLYSGPAPGEGLLLQGVEGRLDGRIYLHEYSYLLMPWCWRHAKPSGAWLGTGDARFGCGQKDQNTLTDLVAHLTRDRLEEVVLVGVPHHGGSKDTSPRFWEVLPHAQVGTFHTSGQYTHPSHAALYYAQSAGVHNIIVDKPGSKFVLTSSWGLV
ncbi:hypothetical protein [Nesterenkonia populi]